MEELTKLYHEVFNEDGSIQFCGREKCIALILAMEKQFEGVDFGNKGNGFLNIKNIQEYYAKLK